MLHPGVSAAYFLAAMIPAPLLDHLDQFVSFARSRTGDPELAADLVQECLMKALKAEHMPDEAEGVVTWFYRVLRHAIIDASRRRATCQTRRFSGSAFAAASACSFWEDCR